MSADDRYYKEKNVFSLSIYWKSTFLLQVTRLDVDRQISLSKNPNTKSSTQTTQKVTQKDTYKA